MAVAGGTQARVDRSARSTPRPRARGGRPRGGARWLVAVGDPACGAGRGGGRGRSSKYEPVAEAYVKSEDDESVVIRDVSDNDIQNMRNLLYRRFGKEEVIVRSSTQEDGSKIAVVRDREGNEYLGEDDITDPEPDVDSEPESEDTIDGKPAPDVGGITDEMDSSDDMNESDEDGELEEENVF